MPLFHAWLLYAAGWHFRTCTPVKIRNPLFDRRLGLISYASPSTIATPVCTSFSSGCAAFFLALRFHALRKLSSRLLFVGLASPLGALIGPLRPVCAWFAVHLLCVSEITTRLQMTSHRSPRPDVYALHMPAADRRIIFSIQ